MKTLRGVGLKENDTVTSFDVVPPQDNGWSLTPMENLIGGVRNVNDVVALELVGRDGVVAYKLRTNNMRSVSGMLQSYFPQAVVERKEYTMSGKGVVDEDDWLSLKTGEIGMVQTLGLSGDAYLPLRIFDEHTIANSLKDPLAGVIGILGTSTRGGGESEGQRLAMRLVLKPARADWGIGWQAKMQKRRDGEDRSEGAKPGVAGPSGGMLGAVGGLGLIGFANWWVWQNMASEYMIPLNLGLGAMGVIGYGAWSKMFKDKRRPYLDEELVEAKLKSLAFWAELQVVRVINQDDDLANAKDSMERLIECLEAFDDPAGNSWKVGPVKTYRGASCAPLGDHPFFGGGSMLGWVNPGMAKKTALSAREVSSLWHLPLGAEEMVSMERTAAGVLFPFLGDLAKGGPEVGPLVGVAGQGKDLIRFPESAIRKHAIILGKSGVGKSTMIKHIIAHKLERKAMGKDDGAVVVIDPHAELVRDVLRMVPLEIADKVRLLDFGRMDRVPGINLVDPVLFPDRDRCVDTIISTVKHLWEHWGGRLEDLLKRSLLIVYEYNSHPDTPRNEMLTMLDILVLLEDGKTVGQGKSATTEKSNFQNHVLSRVSDPRLKEWFNAYMGWDRSLRSEAVGPVHSRIGAYASDMRAAVIMGQRESTINLSDVLSEGLVLLVSTAQGTIGVGPAALMGGTMVSLVESAIRDQESLPPSKRAKCLLVCDEFQTVTGANWEGMLAESRKYGCSLMLATQSLARLDTPERKLKAGVLGNVGCIVGYQMSAEDARIVAPEMDADRVQENFLVNLHPHSCYVRINSDTKCYSAFSMSTLPPPDMTRGSDEAERAVVAASAAYTTDWKEARERMNKEISERLGFLEPPTAGGGEGGGGAKAGLSPAAAGNPFQAVINDFGQKRVGDGNLKGIKAADLANSKYSEVELKRLMTDANTDTGVRAVLDKRLGDRLKSARSKVEENEGERIRGEEREKVEKELEEIKLKLDAEKRELELGKEGLEAEIEERLVKMSGKMMVDARVEMAKVAKDAGLGQGGVSASEAQGGEGEEVVPKGKYDLDRLRTRVPGGGND